MKNKIKEKRKKWFKKINLFITIIASTSNHEL